MKSYIKGKFSKSLFMSDNGYVVGLFKVKETDKINKEFINKTVTFTGYFHELNENDTYIFNGNFQIHPKYGEQFAVDSYERCMPEEKDSIVEFLSSGLFKGIGEKKAEKIVSKFGTDTLNIIMDNPEKLVSVPTITKKQISTLHDTLEEYQASYKIIIELSELGFSTRESMIIYNKYKNRTKDVIDNNIYKIYEDIREINFKKIDSIAIKLMDREDNRRVSAGIIYVIEEIYNNIGHSYLLINEIYDYISRALNTYISKEIFIEALNSLILDLKVIKKDEKYYLKYMYEDEMLIVNKLSYLEKFPDDQYKKFDNYIEQYQKDGDITYNQLQLKAIKSALTKHVSVITGGPGSGKTTLVKAIIEMYQLLNKMSYKSLMEKVALLAPTGRASKRLSETTNLPASTIHRFLKWNKDLDKFQINEHNQSDVEFVIIDEASMVDVSLFASLIRGLKHDTKIVIVGDYNQLPSVGPGQVLKDLIESDMINTVKLKSIYRQKNDSHIINLAYDVNEGIVNRGLFNEGEDLQLIEVDSNELLVKIKDICFDNIKKNYRDFQILVPMYKTINGIDNINKVVQAIFNPKDPTKNEIKVGDAIYREEDKILLLNNMPDENIFNGDIGIIERIEDKDIYINFEGNIVKFTPANYQNLKHGYAISIHKSQGSEFKTVVIPVVKEYKKMLYRKLYYTGITRAKEKLILVGDLKYLDIATQNNNSDMRRTTIKEMLIGSLGEASHEKD